MDTYKVYKSLYHYTNWEGLNGILDSNSLWATNYQYLNDEKEIKLFMEERLPEYIFPYLEKEYLKIIFEEELVRLNFFDGKGDLNEIIIHDTNAFIEACFQPTDDNIYITSFCGETGDWRIDNHGLLSQWRSYGKDGGFCLVFDTKELTNLLRKEHKKFSYLFSSICDVVYSDDDEKFKEEFDNDLKKVAQYIPFLTQSAFYKKESPSSVFPVKEFLNCITRYKHFGFREEKEVRIVSLPVYDPKYQIFNVRKEIKNRGNVSYIDLFSELKIKLPITKIIVGPHRNKYKHAEFLKDRLQDDEIEILISEIPYIEPKKFY